MKTITRVSCWLAMAAVTMSSFAQPAQQAPSFEVASVKLNKSGDPPNSNFPLGPGDVYVPNGGLFSATSVPLVTYLFFAYKIIGNQGQYLLPQLPGWASTERFDIQARAAGNPGKDQMRTLMRSLLAERFNLRMHTEGREVPVMAFVLSKPGKLGPQLRPHPVDASCQSDISPSASTGPLQTTADGLPVPCNGIFGMPPSARAVGDSISLARIAGRNITLKFLADSLSLTANLGRPMVDKTGLSGTFDFSLEFAPKAPGAWPADGVSNGPTLQQALSEQLGIKLESTKSTIDVYVLDHLEHPSEN